jgi:hypothetical protein
MKRAIIISVLIVIYALLAYSPDPFFLLVFTLGAGLWLGLPILIGCLIASLIAFFAHRSARIPIYIAATVVSIFAFSGLAIPANVYIHKQAEITAKEYPERIIPFLEAYREEHGHYPTSLDEVPNKPPLPRLLRTPHAYKSDGTTFSFFFPKPGGFLDAWHFSSDTREWQLAT